MILKIGLGQGGHPAPEGRFTYACSLRETGTRAHGCGGALVGKKWVLTAAHCVSGPESLGATPIVYVGAHGIDDETAAEVFVIPSEKVFVHEGWTGNGDDGNDIALLLLERESTKTPVRLPDASQQLGGGQIVAALGWGRISDKGPLPSTLQVADDLEFVKNSNCLNVWSQIKDNMLCAHATSQGTCQGKCDSGGPLVIPDERGTPDFDLLVGLVSFGPDDCGSSQEGKFKPGVYTRVSSFRQWIDEKMGFQTSAPGTSPPSETESPSENGICREDCDQLNSDLYNAAGSGDSEKELLSKGADPSSTHGGFNSTPLHVAAEQGHVEIVEMLIEKGANVDAQNNRGVTALYFAAQNGHLEIARVLVQAGATVDLETERGATPLIIAAENGELEVAGFLLESGANVNARNDTGDTPLHKAGYYGNPELVRLLLDNGAEKDSQAQDGETPLVWAAKYGSAEAIEVLKNSGADLSIIDQAGGTIEDEICRCLEETDPENLGCREGTCGEGEIERLKKILKG
ncbi:hypothetical protein BSKO_04705 [Bryopsis sp. KO-2023]|nr:hypothetical protein BSKO_04705 [Bryopsis sp. KO-2023]